MLHVEVIYIPANQAPIHIHLQCPEGSTVQEVLTLSGLPETHAETMTMPVGIFSKRVTLEEKVKDGDRIEIYRELLIDPKEKRRERAKSK